MAKLLLLIIFSSTISILATADEESSFARNMSPESLGLKSEKLTHLHFYFHDTPKGPHTTTVRIAAVPNRSKSKMEYQFGDTFIMDDPLTVGPDLASDHVGHAQGVYSFASETEAALIMAFTFEFTKGKYNGSNLSVVGRNTFYSPHREMPIVGGTGVFRFARGYVEMKTHVFNLTAGYAVIEYHVYVLHY